MIVDAAQIQRARQIGAQFALEVHLSGEPASSKNLIDRVLKEMPRPSPRHVTHEPTVCFAAMDEFMRSMEAFSSCEDPALAIESTIKHRGRSREVES